MDRQVPGKFCYRVQNSTQKADGGKFQSVKLIAKLLRPKRQVSAMTAAVVNSKCQKDLLTVLTLNTHASDGLSWLVIVISVLLICNYLGKSSERSVMAHIQLCDSCIQYNRYIERKESKLKKISLLSTPAIEKNNTFNWMASKGPL